MEGEGGEGREEVGVGRGSGEGCEDGDAGEEREGSLGRKEGC